MVTVTLVDSDIGAQAIVLAFWMGTPEPSRGPVRRALEQMDLLRYVAEAGLA